LPICRAPSRGLGPGLSTAARVLTLLAFSAAANDFEKAIRSHLEGILQACGVNYEVEIRPSIKGPQFLKTTLGQCIAAIREVSTLKSVCVTARLPKDWDVSGFLQMLTKINNAWVDVKHGSEVPAPVLLAQMEAMLKVHQAFKHIAGK
jgi:hypothetical protein